MMTKEKLNNLGVNLRDACIAEQRRPPGENCGFVLLVVESTLEAPEQVHLRSLTNLVPEINIKALEMALLHLKTPATPEGEQ